MTSFFPTWPLRIVSALLIWLTFSLWAGSNHYILPRIPWVIAPLALIFFSPRYRLTEKRNLLVLRFIQGVCFAPYVLSGIWKIINLLRLPLSEIPFAVSKTPFEHLAYLRATGAGNPAHSDIALQFASLLPPAFLLICVFQTLSFLPMTLHRLKKPWAALLILFHLINGFVVGIHFNYTVFALAILVLFIEDLIKGETLHEKA
jgi:hypothetical protein